eukprot:SAG11_NODE_923_length_6539_cov_3.477484_5_plen_188_part_00
MPALPACLPACLALPALPCLALPQAAIALKPEDTELVDKLNAGLKRAQTVIDAADGCEEGTQLVEAKQYKAAAQDGFEEGLQLVEAKQYKAAVSASEAAIALKPEDTELVDKLNAGLKRAQTVIEAADGCEEGMRLVEAKQYKAAVSAFEAPLAAAADVPRPATLAPLRYPPRCCAAFAPPCCPCPA